MKVEIEKILKESMEQDYILLEGGDEIGTSSLNTTEATAELQKLFLSKQIELLKELRNDSNPTQAYDEMVKRIRQLESELKQLQ